MDPDGTNRRALIANGGLDGEPAWFPGSDLLAFTSDRPLPGDAASTGSHAWWAKADGSAPKPLLSGGPSWDPAPSPDGKGLAFVGVQGDNADVYVLGETGPAVRLTSEIAEDANPWWSPDGLSIAWESGRRQPGHLVHARGRHGQAPAHRPPRDSTSSPTGRRTAPASPS